jgi:hypothetical protein
MRKTDSGDDKIRSKRESEQMAAYLFGVIRQRTSADPRNLSEIVSKNLSISQSTAYKKISGTVPLTCDEITLLARTYKISIDDFLLGDGDSIRCEYWPLTKPTRTTKEYYLRAADTLSGAQKAYPDLQLFYATIEVTSFQYAHFPELTAFKALMWSRATMDLPEIEHPDFRVEHLAYQPDLLSSADTLIKTYEQVPSVEFLTTSLLDNLLNHILFFAPQQVFADPRTPLLLCEQLEKMLQYQSEMAKHGVKFPMGMKPDRQAHTVPFVLFHNEMSHINTHILMTSSKGNMVFTSFDHPQFISSSDTRLCAYMQNWFTRLRQRSNRISSEGEVQRIRYFAEQMAKINKVKLLLK